MPSTIQIQVTLDEKGVVTGVQNVNNSIDKIPQHAKPAFDGITKGQLEARQGLNELAYAFGIQLPTELTKAASKIPGFASAISALGETTAFAALAVGIAEVGVHVDEASAKIHGLERDLADFYQRTANFFSGNGFSVGDIGKEVQDQTVQKIIEPLTSSVTELSEKARAAGLEGARAIAANAQAQVDALHDAYNKVSQAALEQYGNDLSNPIYQRVDTAAAQALANGEIAIEQTKNKEILELRTNTLQQIQDAQRAADAAGLTGFQQIIAKEQTDIEKRNQQLIKQGFPSAVVPADNVITTTTDNEFEQKVRDWTKEISDLGNQLATAGLQGFDAINVKAGAQESKLIEEFNKNINNVNPYPDPQNADQKKREQEWLAAAKTLQDGITDIETAAARERALIQRQIDDEMIDADNKAAIASLPQWQRAGAQIVEDYNERVRQIQEQLHDGIIPSEQDATRLIQAAWVQMNAQIVDNTKQTRDEMASEIESVFDDITSGNIGQAILSEVKHLFSEIVAQWLLSLNAIKNAGGSSGGGILSSIFGSLFGIGSGGSSSGIGSLFSSSVGALGADASPLLSGAAFAPLAVGASGGGSLISNLANPFGASSTGLVAHLQDPLVQSGGLSSGIGTDSAVQQQVATTALEGSLAKIFPHGLSVGGLNISGAQLAALGGGTALESALFAYSSGNPVVGGIGGVGGGALAGFSIGGPIGAVVGGAIGGIVGIISGIFGANAKRKKALALVASFGPQISQIITDYEQFNTDQDNALSELGQIDQQAKQQLDQLGQDSLYLSQLSPQIVDARVEIGGIQKVRDQRSATYFAPSQFASGGTVPGSGPVPIIAHGGEEVIRQPYASIFRSELKSFNTGDVLRFNGNTNLGQAVNHYHFNISTMDSRSFADFVTNNQNAQAIRKAVRMDILTRGKGSMLV